MNPIKILFLFFLLSDSFYASAQILMRIHQKNGEVVVLPVNEIDSVTYASGGVQTDSVFNPSLSYGSVRDVEGNLYKTIQIGSQEWMAENLRTSTYSNGDTLTQIINNSTWLNDSSGAWCYYNNEERNNVPYGKLYNWRVAINPKNICPNGWHMPSETEWNTLVNFLGGDAIAGAKLKSKSLQHWESPNAQATNSSGFSALASGLRFIEGDFFGLLNYAGWWSKQSLDETSALKLNVNYLSGSSFFDGYNKGYGFSIRCLKDSNK